MHIFLCYFGAFLSFLFSFFFPFVTKKYKKFVFMQKQMISTSEQGAEHLFAGANTQQQVYILHYICKRRGFYAKGKLFLGTRVQLFLEGVNINLKDDLGAIKNSSKQIPLHLTTSHLAERVFSIMLGIVYLGSSPNNFKINRIILWLNSKLGCSVR